ncbi:hypothetical protein E5288_WYG016784 [Bos mutus]|uniref:Regulator of cell cycle RGCC n=1 Tax=Bos mutus TaxID=72004 RepID=A0A6B0R3B8_9CETA|nr:hypothetical protein [Bos mutus]
MRSAPALDSADAGDLTDALCEFDAVLADFASPFHERHFRYEEHLERMKRRSSASVSDSSGFSDSETNLLPEFEVPGFSEPVRLAKDISDGTAELMAVDIVRPCNI